VPQGRKIFSSLDVAENLALALRNDKTKKLEWILEVFPRIKQRLHHRGNELSGGEQQMLAIARVLVGTPEIILLDEPSEGLAPLMASAILETLSGLKETGMTSLLVEANLAMAISLGTRHYVIDQGAIVHEPTTQQLLEDEELLDKYFRI
jgi:branched-chain amino acid transport system ATP-binding protein